MIERALNVAFFFLAFVAFIGALAMRWVGGDWSFFGFLSLHSWLLFLVMRRKA